MFQWPDEGRPTQVAAWRQGGGWAAAGGRGALLSWLSGAKLLRLLRWQRRPP